MYVPSFCIVLKSRALKYAEVDLKNALMGGLNFNEALADVFVSNIDIYMHADNTLDVRVLVHVSIRTITVNFHLQLHDLDRHDQGDGSLIEHDSSLIRDDARPGELYAPLARNFSKINHLLDLSRNGHTLDILNFAEDRVYLESPPIGHLVTPAGAATTAVTESSVMFCTFGRGEGASTTVTVPDIREIFTYDRLPAGYIKQLTTLDCVLAINDLIVQYEASIRAHPNPPHSNPHHRRFPLGEGASTTPVEAK